MSDFLFVAQEMLDNWMMSGKIDFSGHVMTIRGDRRSYVLEPALRFVRVLGDEADEAGLLGKVKTEKEVTEAGGEHYEDSVILNDVAYEVQMGFVARVTVPTAGEGKPTETAPAETPSMPRVDVGAVVAAPPVQQAGVNSELSTKPKAEAGDVPEGSKAETQSDAQLLTNFLLQNLK